MTSLLGPRGVLPRFGQANNGIETGYHLQDPDRQEQLFVLFGVGGGGYARVAAAIKKERARWGSKTLLVDAGDFAEGTLFQTVLPDEALEFRLMGKMGYDALE